VRALAVTALKRTPVVPELPTLDEAGAPGFEITGWSGIAVPAGTPREIVLRLNSEINKALTSATLPKSVAARGGMVVVGTPEDFGAHVKRETERLGKLIRTIGIKPQ
jgi:tripartite-type tricarboxylate transporter receptor subunit TctC